jgi:uncharacterized membrane protein
MATGKGHRGMGRVRAVLWAIILVVAVGGGIALAAMDLPGEKSYFFPRVEIDARVRPNGTLALHERRTFDFTGDFSYAFFTIESTHAPVENIRDFTISENGNELFHEPSTSGNDFQTTWYFDAHDERRTFDISYEVLCAVDVYRDGAHLLWQFIGRGWTEETNFARVTVHVPDPARSSVRRATTCPANTGLGGYATRPLQAGDVRAWGHGPLNGTVRIPQPGKVVLTVRDLQPGQFVEGSILMPDASVATAAAIPGGPGAEKILEEELSLAEEANALRGRHDIETALVWALFFLVPAAMAGVVIWARRRDRVADVPYHLQEPPGEAHPAKLALLWSANRKRPSPKTAYRAQFLHLADTGVLDVVAVGRVTDPDDFLVKLRRHPEDPIDEAFVEFLFDGSVERPVSLREIRSRGTRKERLSSWWKAVAAKSKTEVGSIAKGRARMEATLIALIAIGAGVYAWWRSFGFEEGGDIRFQGLVGPLALVLIPIAAVGWFVSLRFLPPRLPEQLRRRMAKWAAFRRYLKEFSSLEDAPALAVVIWEHHLVYATALGVAHEVEDQVRSLIPAEELPGPWENAPRGIDGMSLYRGWHHSAPSYAVGSATAAVGWSSGWGSGSGGGGGGGGFSGGGGGGGGGTGGGAG